jgi:hypothetical protein
MNNDNYPDIIVAHMKSLGVLYIDCPWYITWQEECLFRSLWLIDEVL